MVKERTQQLQPLHITLVSAVARLVQLVQPITARHT
jgi:hypothetical protein